MRIYELMYILRPGLSEEETDGLIRQFEEVVREGGGEVEKTGKIGTRRLAYKVHGHSEGYYVLMQYSTSGDARLSKELERRLRVSDPVIKFLTVRIDEDLKRIAKLRAKREKRAGHKPAPPAPAAKEPGAPQQEASQTLPGRPGEGSSS